MDPRPEPSPVAQAMSAVAVYLLWLVTAALGIADVLAARTLILEIAHASGLNPWAFGAVDKFGLIILGVGWIIWVYLWEARYRKAARTSSRNLLRSFGLATLIQLAFAVVVLLVAYVIA
jgi:hypothetical protein